MTVTESAPRRRYRPEVRRGMILDEAATLIVKDGISGLTLEKIAREADVSKSLIYNYFDGVTELLKELYERELKGLRRLQYQASVKATSFEEMVRLVTHEYLKYIEKRGLIIERLAAEPSVSEGVDYNSYDRRTSVEYMGEIVARTFEMPLELAKIATRVSFGIPVSAGEFLLRGEVDRDELEDLTVSMILGSVLKARDDYILRRDPFEKK